MKISAPTLVRALTVAALGIGIQLGCEKEQETRSPGSEQKEGEPANLCTEYNTCDACIAGQQSKGNSRGTAETECGAAVLGCWTTWDKPITCAGKEHKKDE